MDLSAELIYQSQMYPGDVFSTIQDTSTDACYKAGDVETHAGTALGTGTTCIRARRRPLLTSLLRPDPETPLILSPSPAASSQLPLFSPPPAGMATQTLSRVGIAPPRRRYPAASCRASAPRSLASAASPALCGLRAVAPAAPARRSVSRRPAPALRASTEEGPKEEAPKPAEAISPGKPVSCQAGLCVPVGRTACCCGDARSCS